jgi:DNA-binding beta-propeller fold protein YncE
MTARVRTLLIAMVTAFAVLAHAAAQEGAAVTSAPTHLLVVDKSAGQLVGVDLASGDVAWRVDVGPAPHEVAAVPGTTLALVSLYGTRGAPGSGVAVVDLSNRQVVRTISTLPLTMPHGLAVVPGTATALVTVEADDSVLSFDVAGGFTGTVYGTGQRLPHMVVVAPDGSAAFAANIVGGAVSRVDLRSGEVTSARVGAGAEGIALTPAGDELWVGSNEEHELHVVSPGDLATLDVIPTCAVPIRVTAVGESLMAVTCYRDDEVRLYGAMSHERRGNVSLPPGSFPVGTIATADGARLFVAATATGLVHEVDVATLSVVRTLPAGREPDGMALVTLPPSR